MGSRRREVEERSLTDATIRASLYRAHHGVCSYEDALEEAVIELSRSNDRLRAELADWMADHPRGYAAAVAQAPVATCNRCGRGTWDRAEIGTEDQMTQPDGKPCGGRMEASGASLLRVHS